MKKSVLLSLIMILAMSWGLQAQEPEEEVKEIDMEMTRPKDIKMANLDSWKNSVFDLYDRMMEIKKQDDADDAYDPSEDVKVKTGENVLLAGKSALMALEVKKAGKIQQVKSIPVLAKCKKSTHSVQAIRQRGARRRGGGV